MSKEEMRNAIAAKYKEWEVEDPDVDGILDEIEFILGLEEGLEDDVPDFGCPECGDHLEYIGSQGNYEEYKCPTCNEYYYMNKLGDLLRGEDAFNEGKDCEEQPFESLNEAAKVDYQVEVTVDGEYDDFLEEYWIPDDLPELLQGYFGQEPVDRTQKQWKLYYLCPSKKSCDKFVKDVEALGYTVTDINDEPTEYDNED